MKVLLRFLRELRPYVKTMLLVAALTIFNALLSLEERERLLVTTAAAAA